LIYFIFYVFLKTGLQADDDWQLTSFRNDEK